MVSSEKKFLTLGILNVTPDSFSDGGCFTSPDEALERAVKLLEDGADFVDVGAESTRPGALEVSLDEEWSRLDPILKLAKSRNILDRMSVDTRKFPIMERVAKVGVSFINCVGPLPTEVELSVLNKINSHLGFIVTHMHGTPENMQLAPLSPSAAKKRVLSFFENSLDELVSSGFSKKSLFLDPGIGFGKSDAANLALLASVGDWAKNFNIAIGISRKGFISRLFGSENLSQRDSLSKALESSAILQGAHLIRTHDVSALVRLRKTLQEAAT